MPPDPEIPSTLWAWIAALFGAGGGGTALVKQIHAQGQNENRIRALETTVVVHSEKLDTIETTLSALNERSIGANERGNRIEAKLDRILER